MWAYDKCLSPTTCRPVFTPSAVPSSGDDRSHMRGNCLLGVGDESRRDPRSDEYWDAVMKVTDRTFEILITALGGAEAAMLTVLLGVAVNLTS